MNGFPMFAPPMVKPMSPPSAMAPGAPFIPFVPMAMNNMTMPPQGTLVASAAPGQPPKEQVITVYVGKIPAGVEDEFIKKILEYCGKVTSWKRFADPKTGKFKPFGFCSFDNPLSLVRAKAILNGLKLMGSELVMTVDDKNQKALDAFLIQRKAMMAAARAVSNANKTENAESKDPEEETILDMKAYILALVNRREKNIDWKHVDISIVLQEAKVIRETLSQSSTNTSVAADTTETTEKKSNNEEDKDKKEKQEKVDKERDLRRKEREDREFREREKAWEQWEKARDSQRDREKDREKRQQNRANVDLQYDDNERKKRTGDYYQKKRIRDRERQDDVYENQKEQEEKEYQSKKLKEKQQREDEQREKDNLKVVPSPSPFTSSSAMSPNSVSSSPSRSPGPSQSPATTQGPTTFSSSVRVVVPITVNTKKIMIQGPEHHEEDQVFSKKKIKLTTLDEGMQKRQQLDNLIKQIPTETVKLFEYPIDWNTIQKFNIVDDKMVPWVAKKVEEYLGSEKSFEEHIVKQLRSRVAPSEFMKQMASVLEDDAEGFCVKLYRKLIFEMLHASLTTENS